VLLEAARRIHLHSRLLLELQVRQDSLLNPQSDYIPRQEQQVVLVMEIHRYLNCSLTSEPHLHLVLEHRIMQSFTQTLEPPMALVRQQPETKQRFCIHMSETHLQTVAELQRQKKRALSSGQYLMPEMVLQRQKNCEPSLELVLHQGCLIRLHLSGTEKSEQPTGMVGRPLTMKLSASTPLQEMQAQQETALQVPLHSRRH
jgi:hypothetical protein